MEEQEINKMVENAYWRFDTINKGNERDAYKLSVKELLIKLGVAYNPEPKEEPEEVKEYVVLKEFNTISISKTKINNEIFKDICASISGTFHLSKDFIIKESHKLYKYASEFERLGFVSEKVYDPVVKINDCFKFTDGRIFMLLSSGSGKAILSSLSNSALFTTNEIYCIGDRLSKFLGNENIKYFKPVKIKIVEGD